MDLPFFSFIGVVLFGYVSLTLFGTIESQTGRNLILGSLLWEVVRIGQYSMTVSSFWNVWSRNLGNMFVSPLSLAEFLIAQMLSGILKAGAIFLLLMLFTAVFFHFNLFSIGLGMLSVIFANLLLAAWSIGLVLLGLVFRYGMRIQALGWALIFVFQPLCGVFFPIDILPQPLHSLALLFPLTYIFEGAREALTAGGSAWQWQIIALAVNALYFSVSLFLFKYLLNHAQRSGQFARNES